MVLNLGGSRHGNWTTERSSSYNTQKPDEKSGHNASDVSRRKANKNHVQLDWDGPRIFNSGEFSILWFPSVRHRHRPNTRDTGLHIYIPQVSNHCSQWTHMGEFQGKFPIIIPKPGGNRAHIRRGGLQQHQQREIWKYGRFFSQFCAGNGSKWCVIHWTDSDKQKPDYAIRESGGSDLVTISRTLQPQGSSSIANNWRKRTKQGGGQPLERDKNPNR